MNLVATNDMDEIYEDPEYGEMGELEELLTKVDKSEDTDDTGASVEAAVKQEEEIVITDAAAVNGGDGDDVNTFAAAIVVEDEAVNAKCVGVEAVKGDIMVKGSKANATAKGQVLKEDERVEGYETREVLGVKMPRRSERHKKISQGLDVKTLNFKTRKQRFKVQELQGSVKPTKTLSVNVNRQLQQQQGKGEQKGQQKGEQRGEQREVRLLGNSLVALFGSVGTGSIQASLLLLSCDPCGPHFVAVLRCHKCCAALPQAVSLKGRPERDVLERLLRDSVLPCDPTPWLCCAATSGERGGWVGEEPTLLEEGSTGTGVLVGGRACAGAAALL
ncbi:unnamed protein product [Closterium sp. NIES-64]|nr:unnamed protein product [Closterium sp. NIES-64]CAI5953938.1 unnamed protein product [Closterium sp. NIES-64]